MADDVFTDPGTMLRDFDDVVLVACPSCGHRASVVPWPPTGDASTNAEERRLDRMFRPRRLVCSRCPHHADWAASTVAVGDASDPWFRLPLWLQEPACGHTVWAWNGRHLDLLEAAVGARQRKRTHRAGGERSLVERLPGWLRARKNRSDVLAAIDRLRARLPAETPMR